MLQLHDTWNWFLMFNIMCFPRNSLDSAMLWSSHTYTVVTSAGRLTWMKQIGRKCGRHRSKFVIGVINVFSARAAHGMVRMMVLSWSWWSWWSQGLKNVLTLKNLTSCTMLSLAHLGHIHKTLWDKNFLSDKGHSGDYGNERHLVTWKN